MLSQQHIGPPVVNGKPDNAASVQFNEAVAQRIDSLIFGYFQRMGYKESTQWLCRESFYLSGEQRKVQIGEQMVISLNDRVHDRTLEDIVTLFIQDGRFDVSREMMEFGESLRQLTNRYTTMTTQPNVVRSDLHQKLYGKPSISRHMQPTGYMAGTSRGSNFSAYTLQQSAIAKSHLEHQAIIQQAEANYRQQQQQQNASVNIHHHHMEPNQLHHQIHQNNIGNERIASHNSLAPNQIPTQHDNYQNMGSMSNPCLMGPDNNLKQSASNHSEGSSRRKHGAPQNYLTKMKEAVIDPIVGMCNEKAWDNVSDIHLDDTSMFPGLDVIEKDFLATFDYFHDEERNGMDMNGARQIEEQFINGDYNPENEYPMAIMPVDNEVVINSSNDVEMEQAPTQPANFELNELNGPQALPPAPHTSEAAQPEVADSEVSRQIPQQQDLTLQELQMKISRDYAPQELISPIESNKAPSRNEVLSDEPKRPRRHDRSSSELSDDRERVKMRDRKEKERKENRRDEEKRRFGGDSRRDRNSKSPKRDVVVKSRAERRMDDSPRREREREQQKMSRRAEEEKYNKEKMNQKRKERERSEKPREERRNDSAGPKRPRLDRYGRNTEKEKVEEVARNDRRKDSRSQREMREASVSDNASAQSSTPSQNSSTEPPTILHKPETESTGLLPSFKAAPNDSSKAKTSMLYNKLRAEKRGGKPVADPFDTIDKDIKSFNEKSADEISVQHKAKQLPVPGNSWKIPKKSSSSHNVISTTPAASPSSTASSSHRQHGHSSSSHSSSQPHVEKGEREREKKNAQESSNHHSHHHQHHNPPAPQDIEEMEPLCEGDERENHLAFIEPKFSMCRLSVMMVNCDMEYERVQKERQQTEYGSPEESSSAETVVSCEPEPEKEKEVVVVNTHPKSVQYAPQKVNLFATTKMEKSHSDDSDDGNGDNDDDDDEDDDEEEGRIDESMESDGEVEEEVVVKSKPKPEKLKPVDLAAAASLLDKIHAYDSD